MRITQQMLTENSLSALGANTEAMAKLQEQISTGKQLNRPSDDPAQVREAVNLHDTLAELAQYGRNVDAATRATTGADTGLSDATASIQRLRELAIQGANSTLGPSDRQAMLKEVTELGSALVQAAATKVGDRYVFSGYRTDIPPYGSVNGAYQGDGGAILARVSPGVTIQTNVTADVAFGPALAAVTQMEADLGAGQPVSAATITALDAGLDALTTAQAQLGARSNRLDQVRGVIDGGTQAATQLLSSIEDVDVTAAISHLASRQLTYQASLQMTGRILQQSLLDVLR
jgi:flagellar hook-associated protein 3 FlgL